MRRIYLDHNATTPLDAGARAAMLDAAGLGNPSSLHAEGRRARSALEQARASVAELLGAGRDELVFTSGGTEGDNLAVLGLARAARALDPARTEVVTSALEHPAVLGATARLAAEGFTVHHVHVLPTGALDAAHLEALLGARTALVTLQRANHELGTLYPVGEWAAWARRSGARVHSDLVQAAGKVALDVRALGLDAATVSAHKLHGPMGVGALYLARASEAALGVHLRPLQAGGHQERERRPGTENLLGAIGFGAACARARAELDATSARVAALRDRLEAGARALGARVHGAGPRVANTSNLAFDGVDGELLLASLDLAGVAVSTGAACSSGSVEPSPVIRALGLAQARAKEAVRFSLGRDTTADEIDAVLALLPGLVARIRAA